MDAVQRHRLGEIGAQPDDRNRRIAFDELGKAFASEAHSPDEQDAYSPTDAARRYSLVRRNVCLHPRSSRPAILRAGPRRVRRLY